MNNSKKSVIDKYGIKLMDENVLLECMNELNIRLTPAQLRSPTTSVVKETMLGIIEMILDKSYETIERSNSLQDVPQELFSGPLEYYEQAVIDMDIVKHIRLLMEAAGIFDFSLNDLLYPTGRRFHIILCAIVNFAKYREAELRKYQEMVAHVEQVENQKIQMEEELANCSEQLKQYLELQNQEEPIIQSLERETKEMTQRIQQLHLTHTELVNERKHLKKIHNDNVKKIEEDTRRVTQYQNDCAHMRDQIVHNPEQLRQRIEELKQEVVQGRAEVERAHAKAQDCRLQLESIRKVVEGTDRAIKTLQEYAKEKQRHQELKGLAKQKRLEIGEKQDECADLQGKEKHLTRQIQNMSEKYERMKREHEEKKKHCNQMLNDARRAKNAIEENNEQIRNRIRSNERIAEEMRARMEQEKRKHLQQLMYIQSQYAELEGLVMNYNRQLFESANVKQAAC